MCNKTETDPSKYTYWDPIILNLNLQNFENGCEVLNGKMGERNVDPALCHEKHELLKVKIQYSILNGHQWLVSYYSCFNAKEKIHGTNMIGTRTTPPPESVCMCWTT